MLREPRQAIRPVAVCFQLSGCVASGSGSSTGHALREKRPCLSGATERGSQSRASAPSTVTTVTVTGSGIDWHRSPCSVPHLISTVPHHDPSARLGKVSRLRAPLSPSSWPRPLHSLTT
ncbi:hypothetical protein C8Q79DRAFT_151025 [Trametes meyenii]|nr:hypothetical protein C8Q79DRAFT_151025 [Trametes meyenii]